MTLGLQYKQTVNSLKQAILEAIFESILEAILEVTTLLLHVHPEPSWKPVTYHMVLRPPYKTRASCYYLTKKSVLHLDSEL